MSYNLSAATFIRNNYRGAFCLYESMASFLPFVDDMTILDCESTDGTYETLQEIADANPKIRVVRTKFSRQDASAFADIANDCVAAWEHESGLFWQADEIWHENLLRLLRQKLEEGHRDMTFWRYQLKENFQVMRWPPHPIHRLGTKGNFHFVDDGMNSNRVFEPPVCSNWDMGWFIKWGDEFRGRYPELPTHEMVLDVSAVGAFLNNIIGKRTLHAPMWHEQPNVDGEPLGRWMARERHNPNWSRKDTRFNIPQIMRWHLGRARYDVRPELIEALKTNTTERIVGL